MTKSKRKTKLPSLKKKRGEIPQELRDRVKAMNKIKKSIREALKDGPKTVPELAEITGYSTEKIFWTITSMRKYEGVVESKRHKDLYFSYSLPSTKE